jgi:hypothetical protein
MKICHVFPLLVSVLLFSACGGSVTVVSDPDGSGGQADGQVLPDGSTTLDGGKPDGAQPDGSIWDGSLTDGSVQDAATIDGGSDDAALPDSGGLDGGPGDSGIGDAGVVSCSKPGDCAPYGQVCKLPDGVCKDCMDNGNCDMGKICVDYTCVTGCKDNRDCTNPLFCDTTVPPHGKCVECNLGNPCTGGLTCENYTCVFKCKDDIDCPGKHCDKVTGACVDCVNDGQCDMGKICINDSCVEGCRDDRDCTPLYCDDKIGNGKCVECTSAAHCPVPAKYACIDDKCVFQCQGDIDCPGRHCNLKSHVCVECTESAQCGIGKACYNDACVKGCSTSANCTAPQVCDKSIPPNGGCVDCLKDEDCGAGKHCSATHTCVACRDSNDCTAPAAFCLDTTHTCVQCRDNSDCPNTYTCDVNTHVCKSPLLFCDTTACTSSDQCPPGGICTDYNGNKSMKCRPPCDLFETCDLYEPGDTCSTSGQKVCGCYTPCKNDNDCFATFPFYGLFCDPASGRCIECNDSKACSGGEVCRFSMCTTCTSDTQCLNAHPDRPWCSTAKTCVACRNDGDCKNPSLPRCSSGNACVECTQNSDCTPPETCSSNICSYTPVKKGPCEVCAIDGDCQAGLLCKPSDVGGTNLKCRKACSADTSCTTTPFQQCSTAVGYCYCTI